MGSKAPPDGQKELEHSDSPTNPSSKSSEELERLLKIKDQEIRSLKFELEKYKLALSQSQQLAQRGQQIPVTNLSATTEKPSSSDSDRAITHPIGFVPLAEPATFSACATAESVVSDVIGQLVADQAKVSDTLNGEASKDNASPSHPVLRHARHSTASATSTTSSSGRVIFKASTDDEDEDDDEGTAKREDDGVKKEVHSNVAASSSQQTPAASAGLGKSNRNHSSELKKSDDDDDDDDEDLYNVIQDVGEIDLEAEIRLERKKRRRIRAMSLNCDIKSIDKDDSAQLEVGQLCDEDEDQDEDDDEDIISGSLLTSLTDAAINNLSQLAALQERCESQDSINQQQHQQQHQQQQQQAVQTSQPQPSAPAGLFTSRHSSTAPQTSIVSSAPTAPIPTCLTNRDLDSYDPFSASSIASQAALAISAAAASSSLLASSSASSLSPNSTIHVDLNTGQSLASAVAAAAVAAAVDQQQQQQHHQNHHPHQAHQLQSTAQSRLISSALSSPEFYHNLQQHHRAHSSQQQASLAHQMSAMSALHAYSPTPAMSPSPSNLSAHSRRSGSNASSSFMSPISSPNYLRRQFLADRLAPMMSPSPSLTTGSSSAASGSLAHILQQHQHHHQQRSASALAGSIASSSSTPMSGTGSSVMSPPIGSKSSPQARLNNMQIRHKFGYLGSGRGQFNSPHGFCLGLNQEIVVADTNNHRICIFDKSGSYITQFGSAGKEEGQLWNPRKVAILHRTPGSGSSGGGSASVTTHQRIVGPLASSYPSHFAGGSGSSGAGSTSSAVQNTTSGSGQLLASNEPLYVVCDRGAERSRMQLFTKDGSFIKKIGIHYIDIVAGLAITQNGLIIVVDSVSPTVYIINAETGTLNGWFDCSGHMKEPSDIAVKSELPGNEYFICDFKGHCVVVFNEQGEYLRKIGHDGLTSYPNGIDISDDGDILVGDSHGNRFHVVVFDRNGNFVSQFECPHVKVSRCCGLKITREGYIVTLAKNNHHVLVLDTIHI